MTGKPGKTGKAVPGELERRLACLRAVRSMPGLGQGAHRAHVAGLGAIDACFGGRGLPMAAVHEVWTDGTSARACAAGFATALAGHLGHAQRGARAGGDLVWIYPRGHAREWGLPYGPGLMAFGHDPGRFIMVEAKSTIEALWAGEEALRAASPAGVVIALDEAYGAHAFMASRRLELAVRAGGPSAFLLCLGAQPPASAASLRWRVAPVAGAAAGEAHCAPADAGPIASREHSRAFPSRLRWRVVLERNRLGRGGTWIIEWNHETATLAARDAGDGADAGAVAAALVGRAGAGADAAQCRSESRHRLSA